MLSLHDSSLSVGRQASGRLHRRPAPRPPPPPQQTIVGLAFSRPGEPPRGRPSRLLVCVPPRRLPVSRRPLPAAPDSPRAKWTSRQAKRRVCMCLACLPSLPTWPSGSSGPSSPSRQSRRPPSAPNCPEVTAVVVVLVVISLILLPC